MRVTPRLFAKILLLTILACHQENLQQGPPPSGTATIPAYDLWSDGITELRFNEQYYAEVFARADTKTVWCSWIYLPSPPSAAGKTSIERQYSTTYWPTDIGGDGGLGLYVAGRRPNGKTTIEKWNFSPPPSPPLEPMARERTSVQTLLNIDEAGRRDVVQLAGMATPTEKLMVYFDDSRDVWVMDVGAGSWNKVASPTDQAVLVVPDLTERWGSIRVRKHVSVGTMYVFSKKLKDTTLTLIDADNNGIPDSHMILTTDQWGDQGFGDPASYVD